MRACTHGMPSPSSCLDCMDEGNLPPRPKPKYIAAQPAWPAMFPGRCPACDRRIEVGDEITRTDDDVYVHERCAS